MPTFLTVSGQLHLEVLNGSVSVPLGFTLLVHSKFLELSSILRLSIYDPVNLKMQRDVYKIPLEHFIQLVSLCVCMCVYVYLEITVVQFKNHLKTLIPCINYVYGVEA